MKHLAQHDRNSDRDANSADERYERPTLIVLGRVAELTQGGNGEKLDGGTASQS